MKSTRFSRITPLKRSLLTLALGLLLLSTFAVSPAAAKRPCWKDTMADWFADSKVDGRYPIHCYKDAIKHLPPVTESYSRARDEIRDAMLFAIAHPPKSGGGGAVNPVAKNPGFNLDKGDGGDAGLIQGLLEKLGPKNADAVPLPLLVLAGISMLLLGTAGASYVARRVQTKRLEPAPIPPDAAP